LQTAYIFGLKSSYLESFVAELKENGVDETESIECAFHPALPTPPTLLRHVQAHTPGRGDFHAEALGDGWLRAITSNVRVSVGVNLVATRLQPFAVQAAIGRAADEITAEFKAWLPWLDVDAIHALLLERRRLSGRWNMRFDRAAIVAALHSEKYKVEGVHGTLAGVAARDKAQRLALSIVDQLLSKLYRKRESQKSRYQLADVGPSLPLHYRKEKKRAAP
jgi:hypothetical protein